MPGHAVDVSLKGGPAAFSRSLSSSSAFAEKLGELTLRKKAAELKRLEREVEQEVEARAAALFNPRDGRRHRPGVHLHGSFHCRVDSTQMPISVILESDADQAKVAALNYGANPHKIRARNVPLLWFPKVQLGNSFASLRRQQRRPVRAAPGKRIGRAQRFIPTQAGVAQAKGGGLIRAQEVNHPGIQASYFMELALERVVERVLRKTLRLPRG